MLIDWPSSKSSSKNGFSKEKGKKKNHRESILIMSAKVHNHLFFVPLFFFFFKWHPETPKMTDKAFKHHFNVFGQSLSFCNMEFLLKQQYIKNRIDFKALRWDQCRKWKCNSRRQHLHNTLLWKKSMLFTYSLPLMYEKLLKSKQTKK